MRRFETTLLALRVAIDMIAVFAMFYVARDVRLLTDLIPSIQLPIKTISDHDLLFFALVGSLLWILVAALRGSYELVSSTLLRPRILDILQNGLWWFFVYIGVVYLSGGFFYTTEIPRLVILFALAFSIVVLASYRILIGAFLWFFGLIRPTLVLVAGQVSEQDISDLKKGRSITTRPLRLEHLDHELRVAYGREVLLWTGLSMATLNTIVETARLMDVPVFALPWAYGMSHAPMEIAFRGDMTLLALRRSPLGPWGKLAKRVSDIVISGCLLVVLSPIFAILLLIIQPSPLYLSRRVGRYGAIFSLYKFRSMRLWADRDKAALLSHNERTGPLFKIAHDPRITPLGKFLRRYYLDELPQLINVFLGDMSLVGPRPHLPDEVARYERSDTSVLALKPGLTGMGQVYGRHTNAFSREIELDTYYLEHWSLALDASILLRTIAVVILGKGR